MQLGQGPMPFRYACGSPRTEVPFPFPCPLQALHRPQHGTPCHALQYGCVRQRLQCQLLEGQQVLSGSELGLRPLPAPTHAPQPVPVGRGQLPPLTRHGEELLPPLPAPSLSLYRLILTSAGPPGLSVPL